jgi:anti-sigma B factor antagonist
MGKRRRKAMASLVKVNARCWFVASKRMDMQRTVTIATRSAGEITIIDLAGQIDLGSSPALRKTLLDSLKATEYLAINLGGVSYIDSSGIASLLEVLRAAQDTKKKLVLFGVAGAVLQVLQLTRLTGVFEIFATEEQVLHA